MPSIIHKDPLLGKTVISRQQAAPIIIDRTGLAPVANVSWGYGLSSVAQSWASGSYLPAQIIDTGKLGVSSDPTDYSKILFTRSGLYEIYFQIYIGSMSASQIQELMIGLYAASAPTVALDLIAQTYYAEVSGIGTPSVGGIIAVTAGTQIVRFRFSGTTSTFYLDRCMIRYLGQ